MNNNNVNNSTNIIYSLKPSVREKLEPAILEVFSSNDFHAVGMRQVMQSVGKGCPNLYRYFESKERLLFSFIDIWLDKLVNRLIDHLQGIGETREQIRKMLWIQLDYYERNEEMGRIVFITTPMQSWMESGIFTQSKLMRILARIIRQGQRRRVLNPDVPVRYHIDMLAGTVTRAFLMWIYRGRVESLVKQTDIWFDLVWQGMAMPQTSVISDK